jgi:hypothetical protein
VTPDPQKRKNAIRALMNIALLEAIVLALVVMIYLATSNLIYLAGGVVGAALIFAPAIIRWAKEHGPALRSAPDEARK